MTVNTASLEPFGRRGQPVPLTRADYMRAARLGGFKAAQILGALVTEGLVKATPHDNQGTLIYDLSGKGMIALSQGRADAVPTALHNARLRAVAKRAFGGGVDVRPLLPEYEAQIGDMMRRDVPRQFRPVPPTNRGDIAAFRRAHAERVRAGEVA